MHQVNWRRLGGKLEGAMLAQALRHRGLVEWAQAALDDEAVRLPL